MFERKVLIAFIITLILLQIDIYSSMGPNLYIASYFIPVAKILIILFVIEVTAMKYSGNNSALYTIRYNNEIVWYKSYLKTQGFFLISFCVIEIVYTYLLGNYSVISNLVHSLLDFLVYVHITIFYMYLNLKFKEKSLFLILLYILGSYFIVGYLMEAFIIKEPGIFVNNINNTLRYQTNKSIVISVFILIIITLLINNRIINGLRRKTWILN